MTDWLKNAIFYEIYPQSFADSNGDGIGDFQGIIDHLDYIKELGCNAIWLNPCFQSPFGDAGYDVSDYCKAAPRYGTNEDLQRLFTAIHERGMHVLLDLVVGHTSWEHPWFRESLKPEENEFSHRYIWTDSSKKDCVGFGNIQGSLRGLSQRDGSVAVNYYSHQPALNYGFYEISAPSWQQPMHAPGPMATREALKDVMRFWLDRGCDGFRVDMAGFLVKADPQQEGTIALWQDFRAFLDKEYPTAAMVAEWGRPDRSLRGGFHMDFMMILPISHYADLFGTENAYFSREGKGNAWDFVQYYTSCLDSTDGKGMICFPTGSHDIPRLANWVDEEEAKLCYAFVLSLPGAPFLYYGDEIGMKYLPGIPSVEGGYNRTGSRSPMQWDESLNAGFSTADSEKLYMPLDPDENRPTVEKQLAKPGSLVNEVKKLIKVRLENPVLQSEAAIQFVYCQPNAYPLAYRRSDNSGSVLVVLNPSGQEASFPYEGALGDALYQYGDVRLENGNLIMGPGSTAFIWEK